MLNASFITAVPVAASAAPTTVTDSPYFFATRANSSRLTSCDLSVNFAVPTSKKEIDRRTDASVTGIYKGEVI